MVYMFITSNKGSWKGRDKGPRKGKRLSLIVSRATSDERERAMSEEAELALIKLASPAAAIVARRESCSAMPDGLKAAARDDSSDDEWDPEEVAGASDEEDRAMWRTVVQMERRT
jgi:hypothetical protein